MEPLGTEATVRHGVTLHAVSKVYGSSRGARVSALRDVTIEFPAGTFTAIMGPSGSGKSTLLLCAAGLDRPASGARRGAAALELVGLGDRAGRRPAQLSGGQQQRVAIARALTSKPEVVFADEPTGALDTASGRQVLALLRGLADEQGQTIVMVTHDLVAASYAGRVVFLTDGQVCGELGGPTPQSVAARMAELETSLGGMP